MNMDVVQAVLDIVFNNHMVYLSPILFLLMTALFADKLIDLVFNAVASKRWR